MFIINEIVELDVELGIGCGGHVAASEIGEELPRAAEGKNGAK